MKSHQTPTATRQSAVRIFARHPRLTISGFMLLGIAYGIRHRARTLRNNEQKQLNREGSQYVTVERSGGGV
ncbi:uncharacterized protein B0T15DRAFT_163963 [Chaetomium strumarium]|uniref:Uncharacterized protein n=1 Tax=Chaetomium strumarium TaxID=1170767 RepID=A0AAJ0GVT1_9PEZI|nr:hypothetical protein B0T15DRAFT_163963 [Chaetomium strumarium]